MAKPRMPKALRKKNQRRIDLIYKDNLSSQEKEELEALQEEVLAWVDENFPLPDIPKI